EPLLVPARRPGGPEGTLVRAGRHRGVGTGGARRPYARAAGELGRPHPEPRQRVARIRATGARDRGRRRLGPAPSQGGALARPAGGAVPPPPPPGHGAALLPDGERDGPGLPVALDEPAAPQRRRPGPRDRAVRHPPGGAGGADRKSTRLNSSHLGISYAVFCLKKKKK